MRTNKRNSKIIGICLFISISSLSPIYAQKGINSYNKAIKLQNEENYLKAGNMYIKAYNQTFFPASLALQNAAVCFSICDKDDHAKLCFKTAEDAAKFELPYIKRKYLEIPLKESQLELTHTELYDSLYSTYIILKNKIEDSDDYNPEYLLNTGTLVYMNCDQYDSAIFYANLTLKYFKTADNYTSKGDIYSLNNQSDSAILAYQNAMNLAPSNIDSYIGLGEIYEFDENYRLARNFYQKAYALDTTDIYVIYSLAYLDYLDFKYEKALQKFKTIAKNHPDYYDCYYYIADIYFDLEDYENAIKYYKIYLTFDPDDEDARFNLNAAIQNQEYEILDLL